MEGYIKLFRKITENEFYFSQKFTKIQAWIDLLLIAGYKENSVTLGGVEFDLSPGELCFSQKSLAERWKWDRKTVRRFLTGLQKRNMVLIKTNRITSVITIVNWKKFQGEPMQSTQCLSRTFPTNNNIKNKNEDDYKREMIRKRQYEMEPEC